MNKNLALLLALILCVGLLVSCGKGETSIINDSSYSSKLTDNSTSESSSGEYGFDENITDSDVTDEDVSDEDVSQENFIDKDILIENENEFTQLIPNYSCEIHTIYSDSEIYVMKYKVHPDGIWFKTDMSSDMIIISDIINSKLYLLYENDKTGIVMDESGSDSTFSDPADFFMAWASMAYDTLEKGSSDEVDGRSATVYFYKIGDSEVRYYIDDEMGFCLAYEVIFEDVVTTRWEMKNFQAGNVSLEDISVPAGYTITEIPSE
jgi:hypothetical protein